MDLVDEPIPLAPPMAARRRPSEGARLSVRMPPIQALMDEGLVDQGVMKLSPSDRINGFQLCVTPCDKWNDYVDALDEKEHSLSFVRPRLKDDVPKALFNVTSPVVVRQERDDPMSVLKNLISLDVAAEQRANDARNDRFQEYRAQLAAQSAFHHAKERRTALRDLFGLLQAGVITQDEFQLEKRRILQLG